ncbi:MULTISPECIES: hypothetical protein [unclassified Butyrivibrio]|uniref:hypothetical protein n=1 Tax=unclassified Butyrivibrio TaxID=2639466 RepID=UPI0003B43269|nr:MULTISPECIES: hypothetical protein [unclassified Butyrivibrio]
MTLRKRLTGIWLMAMALLSFGAYTTFFVAQMSAPYIVYWTLPIFQSIALVIYLWGPDKIRLKPLRLMYRLCYATSFLVIPAFVFIFMGLISQYHVNIKESIDARNIPVKDILPGDETLIFKTDKVYVFFPEYTTVDLECGKRPSKSDESITWCCGAAFQHAVQIKFAQDNIEGDHASHGEFYDSPYDRDADGAFTFANGKFGFEFENKTEAVQEAAKAGGSGFMQLAMIKDKRNVMNFDRPRARCYRALAELNGNLCVIDSVKMMHFNEFMSELRRLGVTNAVYMDMGAGWNYSWYRSANGKVRTLFGLPVPWSHNWIVFRK